MAGDRQAAPTKRKRWGAGRCSLSRREDLPNFPNHVLTYMVTKQAAEDPELDAISYGYAPLCAASGLHEYKHRFGYEMIPHQSVIQLHPVLDTIVNCEVARATMRAACRVFPENPTLETIAAVLEGAHASRPPART